MLRVYNTPIKSLTLKLKVFCSVRLEV